MTKKPTLTEFIALSLEKGAGFFKEENLNFWKTRPLENTWGSDGRFITVSTVFSPHNPLGGKFRYHIRQGDFETGDVRSVPGYEGFDRQTDAESALTLIRDRENERSFSLPTIEEDVGSRLSPSEPGM